MRRAGLVLAVLLAVTLAGAALLPTVMRGPRFAWMVHRLLPRTIGQISLGGGRLESGALLSLLLGRPMAVELDDLSVLDPEGTVVLSAVHLTARIEIHSGPTEIIIRDLRPGRSTWRLGRMKHHRGLGFLAAFQAPLRPGRVARAAAQPPPFRFQIANAELDGLDASFDFPTWGLDLADIKATGSLWADLPDATHHIFGFGVHDIDARAGGALRILDEARAARLPFERALIRQVAITDNRPDDLQLSVTSATTGRSQLSGEAIFGGVVGIRAPQSPPGLTVNANLSAPAEALAALGVGKRLGPVSAVGQKGKDVGQLGLRVSGPYEHLTAAVTARDLDLAYAGRTLGRAQLEATASLGPLQADIRRLELVAPGGGRIDVRGSLTGAMDLTGLVAFRHLPTGAFLPPYLRQAGAGILDGEIQLQGGLTSGAAAISRIDVTWTRPDGAAAPRVIRLRSDGGSKATEGPTAAGLTVNAPGLAFADGVLTLRRLSLPALGGRLTIDGQVRFWQGHPIQLLPAPLVALTIRADRIDVDGAGLMPLFGGRLTATARLQGPTDALAARLVVTPSSRLVILGEPYAAPAPVELHVQHDELFLSSLPLLQVTGSGQSRVELRGRIALRGDADVQLTVTDRDLFSLPGLRDAGLPMRGRFDARLRVTGRVTDPALSGEATLKDVSLGNQSLGGGTLTIEEAGHRGARVRGTLFDAFSVDGVLADRAGEPSLNLTVAMQGATLDPLLPTLPPILTAGQATATGRVSMQVRAGSPALFDGHFTELGVSYELRSPAPSRRRRPARVGIRSSGPVDVHMKGWGSELTLDEAGFDFGAGELRAAGSVKRGALTARAQGPIDLGLLAPLFDVLVPDQLDGLSGLARADVRLGGTLASARVQGRLTIDRPVEAGLRAVPGARLRLTSGSLLLEEPDALRLDGVAATLRYRDTASLTSADATVRLDLRLGELRRAGGPSLAGQVTIASGELTSLALGDTVRIRNGQFSAAGGQLVVRSLEAISDHHGRLSIGGSDSPPATVALVSTNPPVFGAVDVIAHGRDIVYGPMAGLKIDAMDADLHLRGDLRRSVTLSGDVALVAGRYKVDAQGAKPAAPARPPPGGRPPARPKQPGLLDQVGLDVHLRCDGKRFVIQHRFLPDLRLRLDLHAGGTAATPKITGSARATDLYGLIALLLVRPFR